MKEKLRIYYDEDGDFLELGLGKPEPGYFKNLGKGIFQRIDDKTGKITGIAIHGFRAKAKKLKDIEVLLPFKFELSY